MNVKIIVINLIFYLVTLLFYQAAKQDPSSSLGYGFFIIGFWAISLLILLILLTKKIVVPETILDKVGVAAATPILSLLTVGLIMAFTENPVSVWYFDKDHHRYEVNTFNFGGTGQTKRIEYYKSADTVNPKDPFVNIEKWLKDSTWVYFSRSGDTAKIVRYKDDVQVK